MLTPSSCQKVSKRTVLPALLLPALVATVLLMGCGDGSTPTVPPTGTPVPTSSPQAEDASAAPVWRYVNSGFVSPLDGDEVGAFTQQLRAFVITSQEELDAFQQDFTIKRTRGTTTSLGRVDFPKSILLAAYYLWRPLQGDPLDVVGFSLDGNRAEVLLELDDSPQGKKYPYLFAPMAMVAIDRDRFPAGEPVEFVFHLDGEPWATVVATVE